MLQTSWDKSGVKLGKVLKRLKNTCLDIAHSGIQVCCQQVMYNGMNRYERGRAQLLTCRDEVRFTTLSDTWLDKGYYSIC